MASYADTTSSGTIYRAKEHYDPPQLDLLTLLFEHVEPNTHLTPLDDTILHASAAHPEQHITKATARTHTRRTAHLLRHEFGIGANGPGKDIVTVISVGHFLVPLLFYSVIAAEGVFSAASAASNVKDLSRTLSMSGSQTLICDETSREVAIAAAKEAGVPADRVILMSSEKEWSLRRTTDLKIELLSDKEFTWRRITDRQYLDDTLIVLIYSSGTTGLPKGVCLTHTNIVSAAFLTQNSFRRNIGKLNPNFHLRTLGHLPTAHIAGLQGYFVNPFFVGGTVYWMPRFNFEEFLAYNKKYKVSMFFTVPPIFLLIAKSPQVTDQFDTLEFAISGAAPLGKELQLAASKKLGKGKVLISQTWGLSESTGSATYLPVGMRDESGSVSGLVPNVTARVIDDDGKDVPVGATGEILLKGPVLTKGYFRNDTANAESYRDGGWYCTGDIGLFKNGFFYVVDRKKELIKYKGMQVAPAELEALLLTHPLILDCAVIGVPIEDNTNEAPRAYVVAAEAAPEASAPPDRAGAIHGGRLTEEQVKEFVKKNAANHKQLRGGVVFVKEIPKSPAGKILRKELRERVKNEGTTAKL